MILDQWMQNLGYDVKRLMKSHYAFEKSENVALIQIIDIIKPEERLLNDSDYVEGMKEDRAKRVLKGIFENVALPAIEVFKNNDGTYTLKDGYHRYTISKFLAFTHIPVSEASPSE